jgi:hypothetical protein
MSAFGGEADVLRHIAWIASAADDPKADMAGTAKAAIFRSESRSMNIGRIVLALLIALSVGMLPAASGAGLNVKPAESAGMSAMQEMPDCCPHKANPCGKAMDDCGAMATCALKCFSFAGTSSSIIVFASVFARMTALFATNAFSAQTGSPPFRPPRI